MSGDADDHYAETSRNPLKRNQAESNAAKAACFLGTSVRHAKSTPSITGTKRSLTRYLQDEEPDTLTLLDPALASLMLPSRVLFRCHVFVFRAQEVVLVVGFGRQARLTAGQFTGRCSRVVPSQESSSCGSRRLPCSPFCKRFSEKQQTPLHRCNANKNRTQFRLRQNGLLHKSIKDAQGE